MIIFRYLREQKRHLLENVREQNSQLMQRFPWADIDWNLQSNGTGTTL